MAAVALATSLALGQELSSASARPVTRVPLFVIGWDGADWSLLDPMLAKGRLPNLATLIARGRTARLASYEPMASPLIWTTLATGLTPIDHGVTDFLEYDSETRLVRPVSGFSRKTPALWNVASASGLRVGVVGWWATWPAEKVNGFFVSDRAAPITLDPEASRTNSGLAFPPELDDAVRRVANREGLPGYLETSRFLDVTAQEFERAVAAGKGLADPIDGTRRILASTKIYSRMALELGARERPALLMTYFSGTDEIGHLLARYHPPQGANVTIDDFRRFGRGVTAFYEEMDRILGQFLAMAGTGDVVLVSDHGFRWGEDRPMTSDSQDAATAYRWHAPEGILVAAGPGFIPSKERDTASVFDVAPLAARLLGLPRDPRGPGHVPKGWISARLAVAPAPGRWDSITNTVRVAAAVAPAAAARESAEAIKKLQALGYLAGARSVSPSTSSIQGARASSPTRRTAGGDNNLGLFERGRHRLESARKYLAAAVAGDPEVPEYRENLADVLELLGRFEEADSEAVSASMKRGAETAAPALLARTVKRLKTGRREEALRLLDLARISTPDASLSLKSAYGRLALDAGRSAEARRVFDELVRARPADVGNWLMLARAARVLGDFSGGRRALEQAVALAPDNPAVLKEQSLFKEAP